MSIDNTKGEVKLVRGSGPPVLTTEGVEIEIAHVVYALTPSSYAPQEPRTCRVTGIDLTRRTVRLQVIGGAELVYTADGVTRGSGALRCEHFWIFESSETARLNAEAIAEKAVKTAEANADRAITSLENAKAVHAKMKNWKPRDPDSKLFL